MRPINTRNEMYKKILKVGKRVAITILCCLPFIILFAYLMRDKLKSDFWQIFIFVCFMAIVVFVEEIIARAREKKKQAEVLDTKKDVFK